MMIRRQQLCANLECLHCIVLYTSWACFIPWQLARHKMPKNNRRIRRQHAASRRIRDTMSKLRRLAYGATYRGLSGLMHDYSNVIEQWQWPHTVIKSHIARNSAVLYEYYRSSFAILIQARISPLHNLFVLLYH